MPLAVRSLGDSLAQGLRDLSGRPSMLVGLLLLLNSIFMPYVGMIHDAQLYSGLVVNRIDPRVLGGDLFFQYGSQDQYSLFSPLMTPLVLILGVKGAFFLGYLVS